MFLSCVEISLKCVRELLVKDWSDSLLLWFFCLVCVER